MADRIAATVAEYTEAGAELPWQFRAACGDPELISDPELMDATRPPRVWDAMAVCKRCPVVAECAEWAEAELSYEGVAGSKVYTDKSRRRRRSSRSRRRGSGEASTSISAC